MKAVGGGDAQLCDGRAINLFVKEGSNLYRFKRKSELYIYSMRPQPTWQGSCITEV